MRISFGGNDEIMIYKPRRTFGDDIFLSVVGELCRKLRFRVELCFVFGRQSFSQFANQFEYFLQSSRNGPVYACEVDAS